MGPRYPSLTFLLNQLLEATHGHWHRLWLNIADIEYGAPDGNLAAVYERLKKAAWQPAFHLRAA